MDELTAIQLLREVLLGEATQPLPQNSIQRKNSAQSAAAQTQECAPEISTPAPIPTPRPAIAAKPIAQLPVKQSSNDEPNYISDDDSVVPGNGSRRSKRILQQHRIDEQSHLHRIVNLVAQETTSIPHLEINRKRTVSRGLGQANEALQMAEWAYHEHFAGAIIDDITGKTMEYRDLIKSEKHRVIWESVDLIICLHV